MKSRKILITGGSGFIGTHLSKLLRAQGHEVRCFDLRGQGPDFGDVRDLEQYKRALGGVDVVYHFAAIVSVPECEKDPEGSNRTNRLGTDNGIEAALAQSHPPHFVFASSAALYGDHVPGATGLSEDLQPRPLSIYARQKLHGEHSLADAFQNRGLNSTIFRFFNVYGPGQDPTSPYSGVISRFAQRLFDGQRLQIFGDGSQTRDFISVHDLVRACAQVVQHLETPAAAELRGPMNLGTNSSTSIAELARLMAEIWGVTGSGAEPECLAPRVGDVPHSRAATARAAQLLQPWKPQVELRQGLTELKNSLESVRNA